MKDEYRKHHEHLKPKECAEKAHAAKARRDAEADETYADAMKTAGNDEQKQKSAEAARQKALHESKTQHKHDLEVCENSPG